MNAAPHTGSPLKHLRAARAAASFERASTSRMDQEFMIRIKEVKPIRRDVKNEGTSGDVYENKGEDDTMSCYRDDFLAEHLRIVR
jgi:hypothetical protein